MFIQLDDSYYPSTQQLRRFFDHSHDVICSVDLDGRFVHVSGAALQVWGYSPEELVGQRYMDYVYAEDLLTTHQTEVRILQGYGTTNFENRYIRKDGTVVPIAWSSQWDPREKVMFCIARDITEQKAKQEMRNRYEQEIRHQHEELRNILERITDGFFALDAQFNVTYWNKQAEVTLGRTREEAMGQNIWSVFPEAVETDFFLNYTKALNEQVSVVFKAYFKPLDGWYEVSVHPSDKGLSVFFRDVTAYKKSREALILSNERFRLAAKSDAIYDWDLKTKAIHWGEGMGDLLGYDSEELQYEQWEKTLHPEDALWVIHDLSATLDNPDNSTWKAEYRMQRKDGCYSYVCERAQIVRNEEGKAVRVVGVIQDISERKKLQLELEEQYKKFTAAVIAGQEQERTLVSQELHDGVNQVLTTVKLYNELCLSDVSKAEPLLQKSVDLLQSSIEEIRSLSKRLSAPSLGNIKLGESVGELIEALKVANKLTIRLVINDVDELELDQGLHLTIYRILQEHLTNVLKHAAASQVEVVLDLVEDNALTLLVTDDGRGFDTKQKRNGIGIKNMIARAESVKGTIHVTSKPGKGCTLTAWFPLL